jgi:excisionase family DNA binding protein
MTTLSARRSPRLTANFSPWITIKEAAAYLGVGVDTIYDACASRGLKHVKIGHSTIRLKREWVDAWAETHLRQAP